jgi:hypothetical protein
LSVSFALLFRDLFSSSNEKHHDRLSCLLLFPCFSFLFLFSHFYFLPHYTPHDIFYIFLFFAALFSLYRLTSIFLSCFLSSCLPLIATRFFSFMFRLPLPHPVAVKARTLAVMSNTRAAP